MSFDDDCIEADLKGVEFRAMKLEKIDIFDKTFCAQKK